MANELGKFPTHKIEARDYTQRFKRKNPPGRTPDKYVVYAVATSISQIDHHFGPKLASNLSEKFPDGYPEGATGIRVYRGIQESGINRHYLVFTEARDTYPFPEELLDHVYRLTSVNFDLDEVAHHGHGLHPITSHIVCQPDCPQGPSLFSDTL